MSNPTYRIIDRLAHDPYKRAFRAFLKKFNCPQLPYLVNDRIRYSIVDIAAGNTHHLSIAIYVFYLLMWPHLTANDKNAFSHFRTVFVRSVLKIRGALSQQILLPWMKKVATVHSVKDYKQEHQKVVSSFTQMKSNPAMLFDNCKMECLTCNHCY